MCQNKWYSKLPWRYHFRYQYHSQGLILGPFYITCFYYQQHILFADDNTLAWFGKAIQKLTGSLKSEHEVALNWINENTMIVNPGKFRPTITDKRKQDHTDEIFKIGSMEIKVASQVKLLGVEINNKLNFEQHINRICKSAANKLNALIRLKRFLAFQERNVPVNSFVLSNFNHCNIAWMSASPKSLTKIENLIKEHSDSCLMITQVPTKEN